MDEQTRSHVFEPFFSTKEPGKGTGLGLASVYGTVKNHTGFIELQSELGKGTTFTICLPLATAEPVPVEEKQVTDIGRRRSGRILVVDDLQVIREMTVDILSDLGYTANACGDGEEALSWFREHHAVCDLVLLDLTMPKLNGRECFRAMKEIAPSMKVIITSGHAIDKEIDDLLHEGVNAFLQKPYEIERLSEIVNLALSCPS